MPTPVFLPPPPGTPARAVLDFWLRDGLEHDWPTVPCSDLWFGGGAALDQEVEARFGALVREAVAGGLAPWEQSPHERLALVLLLDQFTRNVFRATPAAFAGDARAQALTRDALRRGWNAALPRVGQVFLLMPLEHAEEAALQEESLRQFEALRAGAPETLQETLRPWLDSARQHHGIVARFGRFPHRNAVLGRENRADEVRYLEDAPRFGQRAPAPRG